MATVSSQFVVYREVLKLFYEGGTKVLGRGALSEKQLEQADSLSSSVTMDDPTCTVREQKSRYIGSLIIFIFHMALRWRRAYENYSMFRVCLNLKRSSERLGPPPNIFSRTNILSSLFLLLFLMLVMVVVVLIIVISFSNLFFQRIRRQHSHVDIYVNKLACCLPSYSSRCL